MNLFWADYPQNLWNPFRSLEHYFGAICLCCNLLCSLKNVLRGWQRKPLSELPRHPLIWFTWVIRKIAPHIHSFQAKEENQPKASPPMKHQAALSQPLPLLMVFAATALPVLMARYMQRYTFLFRQMYSLRSCVAGHCVSIIKTLLTPLGLALISSASASICTRRNRSTAATSRISRFAGADGQNIIAALL